MFPVFPSYPYISFPSLSTEYKSLQQCSPSCAMSCSQGDRVRGPYGECQPCWRFLWGVIMELSYLTPAPHSHSDSSRKCDKKSDRERRKKRWGLPKGRWDYLVPVVNNHIFIFYFSDLFVRNIEWNFWMLPFHNMLDKSFLFKYNICLTIGKLSHEYFLQTANTRKYGKQYLPQSWKRRR